MKHFRRLLPRVTIALLAFLVALSLTAGLTGADPDNRWGLYRQAVLVFGVAGLLGSACLQGIRALDRRLLLKHKVLPGPEPERPIPSAAGPERRRVALATMAATVAVIAITYVGLVSVWHWTQWPATTSYYGMLAEAFTQGKTYLPIVPPPGLLTLENPYSPGAHGLLGVIGNLSYYQGKYYMYWGPAPAVALAVLKILGGPTLGDEVVVFVAISVLFLFSSLTIVRLKRVYFGDLPVGLMIAGLVIVGTIHPMLWFQNSPSILTAAIASGQAFLVGGVYFVVKALTDKNAGAINYAAAGALWALAMASRLTTVASVIVLVLGVAILALRRLRSTNAHRREAVNMVSLLVPLGLVLGLYGWYNVIRFGSPLETGFRYQFTEFDMSAELERGTLFNVRYWVPNMLYYVLAPARPVSSFPYLRAVYYKYPLFTQLLTRFVVPAEHRVEDATGLLFAAPTLLFALTFARQWLYDEIPRESRKVSPSSKKAGWTLADQGSLGSLLLLAGLAGVVPTFLFFYTTTRYEMDFVPLLAIVATLGMWRLYEATRPYPIQSRLATAAIILIVTVGTLVGFLLAVIGAASRFDDLSPGLYSFLVNFLPHW
ncbi:MAG: hypothetical protein WD906_07705 [Anaerolineales bacterium]